MKSDLLLRLKTEINAWDKVAERHPYSVYRTNERNSLFAPARSEDPFTTNFGEACPSARTTATCVRGRRRR